MNVIGTILTAFNPYLNGNKNVDFDCAFNYIQMSRFRDDSTNVDPVRLSSRTSLELEFKFQDTASIKMDCIGNGQ